MVENRSRAIPENLTIEAALPRPVFYLCTAISLRVLQNKLMGYGKPKNRGIRVHKKIITSGAALIGMVSGVSPAFAGPAAGGGGGKQFGITATTEVRYDSNFSHTSAANVTQSGKPASEVKLSPRLGVNLGLPFGANNLSLSGNLGYDFHRHNSRLDKESIDLKSGLALSLSPCSPSFSGQISRKQSDLGQIAPTASTGIGSVKNTQTEWQIGGTLSCGKSFGLRPTAGITYEEGHNSATQRQINNRNIKTYMAGLDYVHPSIGNISLFLQQRDLRFDNQILPNGQENGNRTRSYGVSFNRSIGARMQGGVSISWTQLNPRQPGLRNFKGLNWSGNVSLQATPLLTLNAAVGKSTSSTLAVASNYNVSTDYSFGAGYTLTPRINLQAGFSTKKKTYQGQLGTPVPGIPALNGDRKQIINGSINYAMSPKLQLSLDGAHETRDANGTFFDYHNNRIALRAALTL